MIRTDTAASSLKNSKETVSDSLLVAMMIIGFSNSYRAFNTVITQGKEDLKKFENKKTLRRNWKV